MSNPPIGAMIAIATIDTGTRIRTIVNVIAFGTK